MDTQKDKIDLELDYVLKVIDNLQNAFTDSEEYHAQQAALTLLTSKQFKNLLVELNKGRKPAEEPKPSEEATPVETPVVSEKKEESRVIHDTIEICLIGFNNNEPVVGKVDTGATVCSLHATDIKLVTDPVSQEQLVEFTNNGKRYKMALETHQAVQTADAGVGYRPVVKFDVKYREKVFHNILFNLNDRSEMPEKILLGKNFLEKGDFLIKILPDNDAEQEDQIDTTTTTANQTN